ncbi:MAG: spermidine synthase [Myxococcales bacterium]|nr:spermidine synthase [Myxococcales bacterium]MCB9642987.1 spermidine synthase [Myxococcales bacterium]
MALRGARRGVRWAVGAAFFFSGLSSLVLENLWVRMLTLVFGGSTLAIVTVLTAFMSGLALGSALSARFADRLRRPVLVYGLLESGVAIYALFIPFFISLLPGVYGLLPEDISFLSMALVRFGLCFAILIVPTTLMGATLPVLSRFFVQEQRDVGADVGILYSLNTFGAVFGAFSGGFLLIPLMGIHRTLWWVAGVLFCLAVALILVGSWLPPLLLKGTSDPQEPEQTEEQRIEEQRLAQEEEELQQAFRGKRREYDPSSRKRLRGVVLGTLALTGALAMVAQVLWSRALAMVIGSSTYAFTLILVVFLIGLAGGAAWGAWLARRVSDLVGIWAQLLVATAITVGLGVLLMDQLPMIFIAVVIDIAHNVNAVLLFAIKAGIAAIPILFPTFLMGTFFALGLAIYSQDHEEGIGWSVGYVYFFNTLGSILGSALAGFLVIPLLGLQGGLALCVSLYLLCSFGLTWAVQHEQRLVMGLFLVFGGVGIFFVPSWNHGKMSLGMFRLSRLRSLNYQSAIRPGSVIFYREGISATVSVEGTDTHRALKVNGKTDASNVGDRSTQISVSALPIVAHGKAKDVAVIGWGSGMTVGAALKFPLRSLVAAELEPAVVEASKYFEPWNFYPLRDKRLRLLYNDGRNFLAATKKQFDVIVSEPSNPWMSGVANLFTQEYFQIAKKRLREGGILCQWVQLYELSYENILSILRSVSSVFPYVQLYEVETDSYDTLLLASMKPFPMPISRFQEMIKKPKFKDLFQQMKVYSPHDIIPRFMIGEREIGKLLKESKARINTDSHNQLEFTAPLDLVRGSSIKVFSHFQKKIRAVGRRFEDYIRPNVLGKTPQTQARFWKEATRSMMRYGSFKRAEKTLKRALALDPKDTKIQEIRRLLRLMRSKEEAPELPTDLPSTRPADRKKWLTHMRELLNGAKHFMKDRHNKCVTTLLGIADDKAFVRAYPQTLFYLGSCYRYADSYAEAMRYFTEYAGLVKEPEITTPPKIRLQELEAPSSRPNKRPPTRR